MISFIFDLIIKRNFVNLFYSFSYWSYSFKFHLKLLILMFVTLKYFIDWVNLSFLSHFDCCEFNLSFHTLTYQLKTIELIYLSFWMIYVKVILEHVECTLNLLFSLSCLNSYSLSNLISILLKQFPFCLVFRY